MPIFANWWNNIVEWFHDRQDRNKLVRNFNAASRKAWISGDSPVLLKAKITSGDPAYKHQYSKWSGSGFLITVFEGRQLSRSETLNIGNTILADTQLVRRLVVLGWDTLKVQSDVGYHGLQWQLKDYILLNG